MDLTKFSDSFRNQLPGKLEAALKLSNKNANITRLVSECYNILEDAIIEKELGPVKGYNLGICRILAIAGYLEESGEYFIPTDEACALITGFSK